MPLRLRVKKVFGGGVVVAAAVLLLLHALLETEQQQQQQQRSCNLFVSTCKHPYKQVATPLTIRLQTGGQIGDLFARPVCKLTCLRAGLHLQAANTLHGP